MLIAWKLQRVFYKPLQDRVFYTVLIRKQITEYPAAVQSCMTLLQFLMQLKKPVHVTALDIYKKDSGVIRMYLMKELLFVIRQLIRYHIFQHLRIVSQQLKLLSLFYKESQKMMLSLTIGRMQGNALKGLWIQENSQ